MVKGENNHQQNDIDTCIQNVANFIIIALTSKEEMKQATELIQTNCLIFIIIKIQVKMFIFKAILITLHKQFSFD